MYAWGWGVHGQLGLGGIEDSLAPTLIAALKDKEIVDIAAAHAHSVFLTSQVKCHVT